jgi:hypothetical protein
LAAAIVFALRQADTGTVVAEVCRKMGISEATFYNRCGGPLEKEVQRLWRSRTSAASSTRCGRRAAVNAWPFMWASR